MILHVDQERFKICPQFPSPSPLQAGKIPICNTNMEMIQIEIKQKIGVICVQQQERIPISRNLELNKVLFIALSTQCWCHLIKAHWTKPGNSQMVYWHADVRTYKRLKKCTRTSHLFNSSYLNTLQHKSGNLNS